MGPGSGPPAPAGRAAGQARRTCPDTLVSAAARRYGEYLLTKRLSNRLPRCLLPLCGALVALVGVLLWTGVLRLWDEALTGLGVFTTVAGLLATLLGLLGWSQRRAARTLVNANPVSQEATEPH